MQELIAEGLRERDIEKLEMLLGVSEDSLQNMVRFKVIIVAAIDTVIYANSVRVGGLK